LNKLLGAQPKDAALSRTYLFVAFAALLLGGIMGLLQATERAGLFEMPSWFTYYQALTTHGIVVISTRRYRTRWAVCCLKSGKWRGSASR
jgi:cytochrome c oxidase subunit 1